VLAGQQRLPGDRVVRADRGADVDDVDLVVLEQRVVAAVGTRDLELGGERRGVLDRPRRDGNQVQVLGQVQVPGRRPADPSCPDDRPAGSPVQRASTPRVTS
jgi:hypothetical protein